MCPSFIINSSWIPGVYGFLGRAVFCAKAAIAKYAYHSGRYFIPSSLLSYPTSSSFYFTKTNAYEQHRGEGPLLQQKLKTRLPVFHRKGLLTVQKPINNMSK